MEYTKVTFTGTHLEMYKYEKSPRPQTQPRKRVPKEADSIGDSALKQRRLDNLKRTRKRFIQLVSINTTRIGKPALLTLTMRSILPISEANRLFTDFFRTLKRTHNLDLCYIGVPEFQKRGAVHYHVLVWGLDDDILYGERNSRFLGNTWARGFLDCLPTDGSPKLAGYLAKYMQKAMHDDRLAGKRAFLASRNVMRPLLFKSAVPVVFSREILGVDIELLTERSFETDWLGRCDYKLFKVL